ncbi:MAG: hypothetical protein RIB60_05790 [Phycisphaerales bacterium]
MLTLDSTYRRTAGLTSGRIARLTLSLTMLAGTTQALAQNTGLGGFSDEPEMIEPEFDTEVTPDEERPIGDLNFDVSVSEYDLVDLHVNNEDLGRVLQLLSIQSQRNIVASNNVEASVTADLYGVSFYEALDAILHVNGFGYIERGNFIYVYTREELAAIQEAARKREHRVFHLNHLNAVDAGEFAKSLLSEGGSISANAETPDFDMGSSAPVGADDFASAATLVVFDYEENLAAIESLLGEIDTRPTQVLVEATILQTTLNEANAFGVDFAIINDMDFLDFVGTGGPLSVANGLITGAGENVAGTALNATGADGNGAAIGSNVGNVEGPSTLKAGIVNEDVAVFLRVLDQVTDVTVVSNPKILTLNRQPARVLVGTKVGYLNTTTTETATTQTVEFLDTGTQLSVRPFVADDGGIRLELKPQVSSAQLREVSDNNNNTVTIPDEDTTELTTNVLLRDGQTAVLGGLFTETTTATRRQVPLLGDIPLIGSAFRGHDDSTRRNEIIFLVTPSIVSDALMDESGRLASSYVDNTRMGARSGTLPWSRDRRVGRLLIEARRHADNGETDMAIFKVKKAIGLAPMSPDARVLLEELTNTKQRRPSRSLMEGIFHRELLEPMPGVEADGRYFRPLFIEKPSSDNSSTVVSEDENWVAPPVSRATLSDGEYVDIVEILPDEEPASYEVFDYVDAEADTEANADTDDSWIEIEDSEDVEVAEVDGEELSSNDDTFQDDAGFVYEWTSPEYDQLADVTEDDSDWAQAWSSPSPAKVEPEVAIVEPELELPDEEFEVPEQEVAIKEPETAIVEPEVAFNATPRNNGVISIESIDSQGNVISRDWTSARANESDSFDAAEETAAFESFDNTEDVAVATESWDWESPADEAPVQLADADDWAYSGPEAFEFDDQQFAEFADGAPSEDAGFDSQFDEALESVEMVEVPMDNPAATTTDPSTGATIVIEDITDPSHPVVVDEQAGGREPAIELFGEPVVTNDPLTMTPDELDAQYALEDDGFAFGETRGFEADSEDVLDVIMDDAPAASAPVRVATPEETVEFSLEDEPVSPFSAMALNPVAANPATTGASGGFLVVPLPTGGVVQIPWPMQDTSKSQGVRWREFSSVPVDNAGFDSSDR